MIDTVGRVLIGLGLIAMLGLSLLYDRASNKLEMAEEELAAPPRCVIVVEPPDTRFFVVPPPGAPPPPIDHVTVYLCGKELGYRAAPSGEIANPFEVGEFN